jgi:hypothetical protein
VSGPDVTISLEFGDPDSLARCEFADPEGYLLEEIANPAMKRLDVAKTYRLILHSTGRERVNWRTVNTAIIERWSVPSLEWIKKYAWRAGGEL